jgi:hypothetical protein
MLRGELERLTDRLNSISPDDHKLIAHWTKRLRTIRQQIRYMGGE